MDALIEFHADRAKGMRELCGNWGEDSKVKGLGLEVAKVDDDVIKALTAIKECLVVKKSGCKHPKKYHDICDGIKYCCNCNEDLEIIKPKKKK